MSRPGRIGRAVESAGTERTSCADLGGFRTSLTVIDASTEQVVDTAPGADFGAGTVTAMRSAVLDSGAYDTLIDVEGAYNAARAAIEKPVDYYNEIHGTAISLEPELRETVLDQVEAGKVVLAPGGAGIVDGGESSGNGRGRVETPYLQLVMERLWDEEMATGSSELRLGTLTRLGGADRIVRTHLDEAMSKLPATQRDRAADLFRPVHEKTNGVDGWVSLEVSPVLAYDTASTLAAARMLPSPPPTTMASISPRLARMRARSRASCSPSPSTVRTTAWPTSRLAGSVRPRRACPATSSRPRTAGRPGLM